MSSRFRFRRLAAVDTTHSRTHSQLVVACRNTPSLNVPRKSYRSIKRRRTENAFASGPIIPFEDQLDTLIWETQQFSP